MSRDRYKYRIHYLLRQLSVNDYEIAMASMPEFLNISKSTWKRLIYLRLEDHYEIDFCQQVRLANFFQIKPFELYSKEIQERYKDLIKKQDEFLTQ